MTTCREHERQRIINNNMEYRRNSNNNRTQDEGEVTGNNNGTHTY